MPAPTAETAVEGQCDTGTGSNGLLGRSASGTGVWGDSASGTGVFGSGYYGVYGTGVAGVVGDVDNGTGVQGWTGAAFAPTPVANVAVWAGAENGRTALQVAGVAKFSRSGKVTIASGHSSVAVTVAGGITAAAFGFANLQANRSGTYVQAVVPSTVSGTITIYLNKAVTSSTACAWLVVS